MSKCIYFDQQIHFSYSKKIKKKKIVNFYQILPFFWHSPTKQVAVCGRHVSGMSKIFCMMSHTPYESPKTFSWWKNNSKWPQKFFWPPPQFTRVNWGGGHPLKCIWSHYVSSSFHHISFHLLMFQKNSEIFYKPICFTL